VIARMILQTGAALACIGAVMFVAAGTFHWPGGWAYLALMGLLSFAAGFWLAGRDPALLAQRLGAVVQKDQPLADKIFTPALFGLFFVWMVFMALDAVRFGWSHAPVWAQGLGGLLTISTFAVAAWVFRENSFAAPVVKIQAGQTVISTGPYALVRHPMYAGAIPYFFGVPLLLGSFWGLAFAPVWIAGLAVRALIEEKTLRAELSGYDAYAARVRYRLVPGVW
jgi:protein-S-isoprenylcysteine O-methyltransferase Ste14